MFNIEKKKKKSTSLEKKIMKYFVSSFYQNFLPPVKRVCTFDILQKQNLIFTRRILNVVPKR